MFQVVPRMNALSRWSLWSGRAGETRDASRYGDGATVGRSPDYSLLADAFARNNAGLIDLATMSQTFPRSLALCVFSLPRSNRSFDQLKAAAPRPHYTHHQLSGGAQGPGPVQMLLQSGG